MLHHHQIGESEHSDDEEEEEIKELVALDIILNWLNRTLQTACNNFHVRVPIISTDLPVFKSLKSVNTKKYL